MNDTELRNELMAFQDYLAPLLDVYEQAVYFYLLRHSRLIGQTEIVVSFKSARTRLACGVGTAGTPMSEGTAYIKLQSLHEKGILQIVRTTHSGRLIKVHLASEIPGAIPTSSSEVFLSLEEVDFYNVKENRILLLDRENHKCFYTLKTLSHDSFVVDHVISRPVGDNSYRNCVAASREANNRKGAMSAEDFLRRLFRECFLGDLELQEQLERLRRLKAGELKPRFDAAKSIVV